MGKELVCEKWCKCVPGSLVRQAVWKGGQTGRNPHPVVFRLFNSGFTRSVGSDINPFLPSSPFRPAVQSLPSPCVPDLSVPCSCSLTPRVSGSDFNRKTKVFPCLLKELHVCQHSRNRCDCCLCSNGSGSVCCWIPCCNSKKRLHALSESECDGASRLISWQNVVTAGAGGCATGTYSSVGDRIRITNLSRDQLVQLECAPADSISSHRIHDF